MIKYRNTKFSSAIIFASLVAFSSVALAGDVEVIGDSKYTLEVVNTYSGTSSVKYAIKATNENNAGHGYAGRFRGGKVGIMGEAEMSGSGDRRGVIGSAEDGDEAIGVYGRAIGGSDYNYGVFGDASGNDAFGGFFEGDVYTTGEYEPSDERLKDEIIDLDGSLDQIMELRPKSFRYRTNEYVNMNLPEGYRTGLLAQDVEQIMPDLVREVVVPDDEYDVGTNNKPKRFLAMNYTGLIPLLIGAIQEQQEQIADLQEQVAGCGCR